MQTGVGDDEESDGVGKNTGDTASARSYYWPKSRYQTLNASVAERHFKSFSEGFHGGVDGMHDVVMLRYRPRVDREPSALCGDVMLDSPKSYRYANMVLARIECQHQPAFTWLLQLCA